jgi:hypothetical protein
MNNKTDRNRTANVMDMFSLCSAKNNVLQLYNGCEVIDFTYSHITLETPSAQEIRKVDSVYSIYIQFCVLYFTYIWLIISE